VQRQLPVTTLVVANLVPLVGVFAFGWDARPLLILYWAENVVVALWTVARMFVTGGPHALPHVAFFTVHFGLFTLVHGIFVDALTQPETRQGAAPPTAILADVPLLALLGLLVSHGISFFTNFIGRGEYRTAKLQTLMTLPYPRMVVLHVAIIAAGFATIAFGQPLALLAILVVLKIGLDVAAHLVEHRLLGKRVTGSPARSGGASGR